MDTTEVVVLIAGLCTAIGGPLALFVKSSLERQDKAAAAIVAANKEMADRVVAAVNQLTAQTGDLTVRVARIESHLRIDTTPNGAPVPAVPTLAGAR